MPEEVAAIPPEMKAVMMRWPDDLTSFPVMLCNIINAQPTPDGIVMTFGQGSPPVLSGTPEEQIEALRSTSEVPAVPLFRIVVSPQVAQQLVGILAQMFAQIEHSGGLPPAVPVPPDAGASGGAAAQRSDRV
jgi:hypothetical protein